MIIEKNLLLIINERFFRTMWEQFRQHQVEILEADKNKRNFKKVFLNYNPNNYLRSSSKRSLNSKIGEQAVQAKKSVR